MTGNDSLQKEMSMRALTITLAALLVAAASTADAYAIRYSVSPLGSLSTSDTIQVDVYLDADPGLQLLSIGVLWETDVLSFQPLASSSPSYILYTPSPGPGEAAWLEPTRDPWIEWPGLKPPGFSQVNLDFNTPLPIYPSPASGTNIWLSSLVFHVDDASGGPPILDVTLEAAGNVLHSYDVDVDPADVPITLIPEPATAAMLGLGLALALRRGRRAWRRAS
jgi:hypothetical protein